MERLANELEFYEIAKLLEFVEGNVLVIHNAGFDIGFLNAELKRLLLITQRLKKFVRLKTP